MSMIHAEDKQVKVGSVVLPGVIKSIEILSEAAVDEMEVQGSAVKPKQAVGYEDAQVKIELIIGDTSSEVAQNKVARIYSAFRKKGQAVPQPMNIVSKETAVSGVDKVIFKKITHKRENKTDLWVATLEFCEYVPVPIMVTSAASAAPTAGSASLSADYQNYLSSDRGTAPRLGDKTAQTPTVDDRLATSWSVSLDSLRGAS